MRSTKKQKHIYELPGNIYDYRPSQMGQRVALIKDIYREYIKNFFFRTYPNELKNYPNLFVDPERIIHPALGQALANQQNLLKPYTSKSLAQLYNDGRQKLL